MRLIPITLYPLLSTFIIISKNRPPKNDAYASDNTAVTKVQVFSRTSFPDISGEDENDQNRETGDNFHNKLNQNKKNMSYLSLNNVNELDNKNAKSPLSGGSKIQADQKSQTSRMTSILKFKQNQK